MLHVWSEAAVGPVMSCHHCSPSQLKTRGGKKWNIPQILSFNTIDNGHRNRRSPTVSMVIFHFAMSVITREYPKILSVKQSPLVGGWATPLKQYESIGRMTFPIYGNIKNVPVTTNKFTYDFSWFTSGIPDYHYYIIYHYHYVLQPPTSPWLVTNCAAVLWRLTSRKVEPAISRHISEEPLLLYYRGALHVERTYVCIYIYI